MVAIGRWATLCRKNHVSTYILCYRLTRSSPPVPLIQSVRRVDVQHLQSSGNRSDSPNAMLPL